MPFNMSVTTNVIWEVFTLHYEEFLHFVKEHISDIYLALAQGCDTFHVTELSQSLSYDNLWLRCVQVKMRHAITLELLVQTQAYVTYLTLSNVKPQHIWHKTTIVAT